MIKAASLTAILFSACFALADEPRPPVALEAIVHPPKGKGQKSVLASLDVRLVGLGKDVSVVSAGLSVRVTRADKKAPVTLTPAEQKDEKGRRIVRSAATLGIVRLQPDEVAIVEVPLTQALLDVLYAAAPGELELVVEYEVAEPWSKRYGVVSGKVRGTATVAK